ncbi:unnamed protein product [Owenia fusiformis]|uniref:Sulfotransferase domain-containing protein n=2 Tax=Owenia fusiformis TaxID=6347 RepID=A0A8S4NDQ0_OWEFU|nr:unnamed protein product [Owenia fusiformis]
MATDCMTRTSTGFTVYGKDFFKDGTGIVPFNHPAAYTDECTNLEIRDDDFYFTGWPRTGNHVCVELIQCVQNNGDLEWLKNTHIHDRVTTLNLDKGFLQGKTKMTENGENPLIPLAEAPSPRFIWGAHHAYEFSPRGLQKPEKCKVIIGYRNPKASYSSLFHLYQEWTKAGLFTEQFSWEDYIAACLTGKSSDFVCTGGSWFDFYKQWWENRNENMYFLCFEQIIKDCPKVIEELANFLGKSLTDEQVKTIADHIKFDNLKGSDAFGNAFEQIKSLKEGQSSHMRKGKIDDWKNNFTVDQSEQFDKLYEEKMKGIGFPEPIYE